MSRHTSKDRFLHSETEFLQNQSETMTWPTGEQRLLVKDKEELLCKHILAVNERNPECFHYLALFSRCHCRIDPSSPAHRSQLG